jgi:hypothetical protein
VNNHFSIRQDGIGSGLVDDLLQAFLFQDPDRERLVRIERHAKLLLEGRRIGHIDSLILLLNPLLIAGLAFVMTTVYEAGKTVAVWWGAVPVFVLFIMFAVIFVDALAGFLWYLAAYLKDSLTGRIRASGILVVFLLWLVTTESSIALVWQFANILNAIGWAGGWYALTVAALLCLAVRTVFRFDVWLAHQYVVFAPLTVEDARASFDELVSSSITSGRSWGFFGRFFWWAGCVLYGVYIVLYVFELAFYGFPLSYAVSAHMDERVIYNIVGLALMVAMGLAVRWRMKRWRLEEKWWAV